MFFYYIFYLNGLIEQEYITGSIASGSQLLMDFIIQFSPNTIPFSSFGSFYDSGANSTVIVQLRNISNTGVGIKNPTSSTVTKAFAFFKGY